LEKARGQILGEDGVRVHSMVLPGLASSTSINFSGPGEVSIICLLETWLDWAPILTVQLTSHQHFQIYTLRHDVTNVQCLMPGLILAIRKVVRLKVIMLCSAVDDIMAFH
jgi:chloroplast NAD(P)H dehydrogenase